MQNNNTSSSEEQQQAATTAASDLPLGEVEKASLIQQQPVLAKQDSPPLYTQNTNLSSQSQQNTSQINCPPVQLETSNISLLFSEKSSVNNVSFRGIDSREAVQNHEGPEPITSVEQLLQLLKINVDDQNGLVIDGRRYMLQLDSREIPAPLASDIAQKMSTDTNSTVNTNRPLEGQKDQQVQCLFSSNSDKTAEANPSQPVDPKEPTLPKFDFAQIMQGFQFDTPGEFDDLLMLDSDTEQQISEQNKQGGGQIQEHLSTINDNKILNKEASQKQISNSDKLSIKNNCNINDDKDFSQAKSDKQLSQETKSEEDMPLLKKHFSEAIKAHFILSKTSLTLQFPQQINTQTQALMATLKSQLLEKNNEIGKLKETLSQISQCLARIYSSPQLLEKDIEDKELVKVLSQGFLAQAKLHLAFLFSSPLILKYKDDNSGQLQSQTMMSIDHQKELQGVKSSLQETGNQIRYRKIPATLDNLRMSLTENPCALHFSGHGIENSKENFGKESALLKNEGNFLIFEDSEGCAQYLSEKKLHQLLEASGTKLEFVFVASCYSQFAGEIFHNAGAKHVICVQRGSKISDEASILFSRSFYHALFSQTVTVCQAFAIAKATLSAEKDKFIATECHKFVLLKDSDEIVNGAQNQSFNQYYFQHKQKKHKCTVFGPFSKGEIQNVATEPMFKLEVSRIDDFLGRRKEMQEVISHVMNNRLITIKGIPGIGKTTLAKSAAYYLDERNAFKDGIILISLRGIDQTNMFLTHLFLILKKNMACIQKDIEDKALEDSKNILEHIINFLKNKQILLVLDNAEDPLRAEAKQFRDVIQKMLVKSPGLTILLTSRFPIGSLAEISEKIILLKELTPHFSIELLFRKAMRPITDQEIADLLKMNAPARVLHSNPLRASKNSMRLDEHHMTQLLGGHPHAISLAAPMLQDKSLKELYALLNSNEIMDWLRIEGMEGTPLASLKVSLDTSIQHMSEHYPKAIKLFCLIGLLPGGCHEEDLDILWEPGWRKYSELLLRASLLVKRTEPDIHYTLLPFMNKYAEDLMEDDERLGLYKKCCSYYASICKGLLQQNSNYKLTTAQNINDVINQLVQLETNVWACIYRMVDKRQSESQENSRMSLDRYRGKSPAPSAACNKSFGDDQVTNKTHDDSSQAGNSKDEYDTQDDNYEQILYTRRQDGGRRSYSEKMMRSVIHENSESVNNDSSAPAEGSQQEERKSIEQTKIETDTDYEAYKDPLAQSTAQFDQVHTKLVKLAYIKRLAFVQPQCLAQSLEERKQGDEQRQFCKLLDDAYSNEHLATELASESFTESNNEIEPVYPTKGCANQLSDDNYNLSSRSPSLMRKHQSAAALDINSMGEMSNEELSNNTLVLMGDDYYQKYMKEGSSEELQFVGTSSITNNNLNMGYQSKVPLTISQQRLSLLPLHKNLFQKQTDELSATSSIQQLAFEGFETSSVESLEQQITSIGNQFENSSNSSSNNTQIVAWNKSVNSRRYSVKNNVALHLVEEIPEEASVLIDEESKLDDVCNDSQQRLFCDISQTMEDEGGNLNMDELKMAKVQKKLSSKKFYEDEHHNERISQYFSELEKSSNYNNTSSFNKNMVVAASADSKLKIAERENNQMAVKFICESVIQQEDLQQKESHDKKQKKKVTYQLNEEQVPKSKIRSRMEESKKRSQQNSAYKGVNPVCEFTPEGALLVYYISNLVLLHKYSDANNAIEQFGLKLQDPLCEANLKKLQGCILTFNDKQLKESLKKFDEAHKIFQRLDNEHGQALCNCAIGYFYYTKSTQLICKQENENQLFKKAEKRLEDALLQYQKIHHYMGEANCHKILGLLKQKMNKNYRNHYQQSRILMKKDSDLQKSGKSMFIQRNQIGLEMSLFIEVVESQPIHVGDAGRPRSQLEKDQLDTSTINLTNNNVQALSQQKEQASALLTSSKSEKGLKIQKYIQNGKPIQQQQQQLATKPLTNSSSQLDLKQFESEGQGSASKQSIEMRKSGGIDSLRQSIQGKEQKELEQIEEYNPSKLPGGLKISRRQNNDKRFPPQVQKDFSQKPAPKQTKHIPRINIQSIEHQVLSSDNDNNRPSISFKKQQMKVDVKKTDQEIMQYVKSRNAKIQSAKESQMSASFLTPSNHLLDIPFQKKTKKRKEPAMKDGYKKHQEEERIFEPAGDCSLSETYKSDSENSCSKYDTVNYNENSQQTSSKKEGNNTSSSKQCNKSMTAVSGSLPHYTTSTQEMRASQNKVSILNSNNPPPYTSLLKSIQPKVKRLSEGSQTLKSIESKTGPQPNTMPPPATTQQAKQQQDPLASSVSNIANSVTTVALTQAGTTSTHGKSLQLPTRIQKTEKALNSSRAQSPKQLSKKAEAIGQTPISTVVTPTQSNISSQQQQQQQQQPHLLQQQKVKFNITATFTVEGDITTLDQSNLRFNIDKTDDAPP